MSDRWYERARSLGYYDDRDAERVAQELERAYTMGRQESVSSDAFAAQSYARRAFWAAATAAALTGLNFLMHFLWTTLSL